MYSVLQCAQKVCIVLIAIIIIYNLKCFLYTIGGGILEGIKLILLLIYKDCKNKNGEDI